MEQFTSIHQKHFISMMVFFFLSSSSSSFIRCAIFFILGKNTFFIFFSLLSICPGSAFLALLVFFYFISVCRFVFPHWIDSKMLSDEIALCEKVEREYMDVNGDSESKTMIRLGLNALGNWFTTTFGPFFLFLLSLVVVFGILAQKKKKTKTKCEYFCCCCYLTGYDRRMRIYQWIYYCGILMMHMRLFDMWILC